MKKFATASIITTVTAASALAAPIAVDGTIGTEWAGITPAKVLYDAAAPNSNFGSPTNKSDTVAYDVYMRGDADYVYVGLAIDFAASPANPAPLMSANLYFSGLSGTSGSGIGFEVQNNRAFKPGVNGVYYDFGSDADYANVESLENGVIEMSFPLKAFTENSLGVLNYTPATTAVRLNASQSFSYSVAGAFSSDTSYGSNRLGIVAVPEPTTLAMVGLGVLGLLRRRVIRG